VTGPLPAPSASGVRVAGDRYQWLVAWHGCVTVLHYAATGATNPAVSVGVEADGAGNVDDVVIRRHRPPHSYKQVKYAVDSRTPVNGDYLMAASRAGGPSILQKIAAVRRQPAGAGDPVELAIVTNRAPDPADVLISGRDARTRLLLPRAGEGGPRSAQGKARAAWAKAAGLAEAELLELLAILDFDLARDRMHLEETVKLTMFAAGLRSDDQALDAIQHAVRMRALRSGPVRTIVSIATLAPDRLAAQAAYAVDWVDRFDGPDAYAKRRPKAPSTWQQLQADIEDIAPRLGAASHVAITGSLRLAPAFTVGAALRMVTNTDIAVMQRGTPWTSDAPYSTPITPTSAEYDIRQGKDLAIAIEVATTMTADVLAYLQDQHIPVGRLVVLGPPGDPRDNAVAGRNRPARWPSAFATPRAVPPAATRVSTSSSPRPWAWRSFSATGGTALRPPSSTKAWPPWGTKPPSPSAPENHSRIRGRAVVRTRPCSRVSQVPQLPRCERDPCCRSSRLSPASRPDPVPCRLSGPSAPGGAAIAGGAGLPVRRPAVKDVRYQVIHLHPAGQAQHGGPLLISDGRPGVGQDAGHIFQRQAVLVRVDDVVHPSCLLGSQPVLDRDQQAEQLSPADPHTTPRP